MIDLHQLSMHYTLPGGQRIEVLRRIELHIAAGQSVAVAGPSGSGKTSMLLLLAGLEQPAAGHVAIDGVRLDTLDRDALADLRRDRIGIVFQSFHLLPSLTALDNVALPLQIAGRADALARSRAVLTALTFALPALGRALTVSPAALFRGLDGQVLRTPRGAWLLTGASALAVGALLLVLLPDARFGAAFVAVTLGLLLLLEGVLRALRVLAGWARAMNGASRWPGCSAPVHRCARRCCRWARR